VMTYVKDEPGYQVNLQCKWILQPTNYDKPSQMYIRVPVIDFDVNNVTEAQCSLSNPNVDVFSMKLKMNDSKWWPRELKCSFVLVYHSYVTSILTNLLAFVFSVSAASSLNEFWCSNNSVKVKSQIVNLWDSSYKLALEFRSDDKQVRSNAKGVQVDVQVLGRDYCHRNMLFFEGSCYLITPERLTPAEAFSIAKNYLGNVFTVPKNRNDSDFFRPFIQRNSDRLEEFPFESPLSLTGSKVWTGYFIRFLDNPTASDVADNILSAQFLDPLNYCIVGSRNTLGAGLNVQNKQSQCAVALEFTNNGDVKFTCESTDLRLPALIEFRQIPAANNASLHSQLFRTCNYLLGDGPSADV
uniref:CUB domain-containing protein n=1 Tax=Macrostomum lignano TaxID=282301 RepID=A0A1I8GCK8_9PLAT